MPESKPSVPPAVHAALHASGFPFQTAIEHVVRASSGWKVLASEFPWQDQDGGDQFLDLVAVKAQTYVAIECKKTQKDILTFLRPGGTQLQLRARLLYSDQIQDMTRRLELYADDWDVGPPSGESEFCVVSTSATGKDQRLLERDAQTLVRATDAYAQRVRDTFSPGSVPESRRIFVPLIVTNADLFEASYSAQDIALDSGQFAKPADITAAKRVRFRKAFTSSGGIDLGHRTVFVVSAPYLMAFLDHLGGSAQGPSGKTKSQMPSTFFRRPARPNK